MSEYEWTFVARSYDAEKQTATLAVRDATKRKHSFHVHVSEVPAPDYPEAETDQQARMRADVAAALRNLADWLDDQ